MIDTQYALLEPEADITNDLGPRISPAGKSFAGFLRRNSLGLFALVLMGAFVAGPWYS